MSNKHKNPTISFRITDAERKQIEARILASGMMKKDYFVRSCEYYDAAEPPVRCDESHLSGLTEPPHFVY